MTTPKPEPASDQSVKWLRDSWITDVPINHGSMIAEIPIRELQGLILRIEAGCARIREQAEEIERLRSALINLRAKCLEMGWGPEAPQLLDASAALSKPEPGR